MNKSAKILNYLDSGIFPATVMLICGFNHDEVMTHLKKTKSGTWITAIEGEKEFFDSSTWMAARRTIENKRTKETRTHYYIYLKDKFDFSDHSMCCLAHEVLHICQFFLPDVLDRNKEREAEAYLHTHLMKQCLKILRGK